MWRTKFAVGTMPLGIASAEDILSSFIKCISKLNASKLIQVSSGRPNVNLNFLELMNDKRNEEELCKLIDLGTCGLHVLHGSLKHGEKSSGWKLKKLLSSLYKIFDESPSRSAAFELITNAMKNEYHCNFVHTGGLNERVAKKARAVGNKIPSS